MQIGCPKEIKPQEFRVGLTPNAVREAVNHGHSVLVETGAGVGAGFADADYIAAGAQVVGTAEEVFAAEMVVKVKEPQAVERARLRAGQVLFTYLHLAPDPVQTAELLASGVTAIAYETVTDDRGGLPLLAPMSEVAGGLAPQVGAWTLQKANGGRGVLMGGVPGVLPARVLVIGGGVVGTHAAKIAAGMGADVTVLDRSVNRLRYLDDVFGGQFKCGYADAATTISLARDADLIIGAVLIPGAAAPKLISRAQLAELKPGAALVDVAIDQGGCFETSRATTHQDPIYDGGRDHALLRGEHAGGGGADVNAGFGQCDDAVHAGLGRQGLEARLCRGPPPAGGAEYPCRASDLCGGRGGAWPADDQRGRGFGALADARPRTQVRGREELLLQLRQNVLQQVNLGRAGRWHDDDRCRAFQLVHRFDQHEHYKRDDQEVDHSSDERAVSKHRSARLFGRSERGRVGAGQVKEHVRKVDAAEDKTDDRVDQVTDKAADNGGEGRPNDDPDRQVHYIALGNEVLEFFYHSTVPLLALPYVADCPAPAHMRMATIAQNAHLFHGEIVLMCRRT